MHESKKFVDNAQQTFLSIIWIFTEGEGDGIESRLPFNIFSALTFLDNVFCETYFASEFTYLVGIKAANDAEMTIFTLMKRLLIILTFWFIFFVSVHNVSLHFCIMDSWWPSNACWAIFSIIAFLKWKKISICTYEKCHLVWKTYCHLRGQIQSNQFMDL